MSGPSEKKSPSIPSWQQTQSPSLTSKPSPKNGKTATEVHTSATELSHGDSSPTNNENVKGEPLLEQARKFLQDPTIRDEPIERKKAFLRSKGIEDKTISELFAKDAEEEAEKGDMGSEISQEAASSWSKVRWRIHFTAETGLLTLCLMLMSHCFV
jgi:hypothetical protein